MDCQDLTIIELRKLAKEQGLKNITKLKKEELIDLLQTEISSDHDAVKKEELIDHSESGYKLTNQEDEIIEGSLEVLPDGYGFLRGDNY